MTLSESFRDAMQSVPADEARPLAFLLKRDHELVSAFRRAVLWTAAVHVLKQHRSKVAHYLAMEFGGEVAPIGQGVSKGADSDLESLDGYETHEVMCIADEVSLADSNWKALMDEPRTAPIPWFAQRVAWRTIDHLQRQGYREASPEKPPPPNGHYAVAYQLWVLEKADPTENPVSPADGLKGVYSRAVKDIREEIDKHSQSQASDAPAYLLKKLFPRHGWRAHPERPIGDSERWLAKHIADVESSDDEWADAVRQGTNNLPNHRVLHTLLDTSATHHRKRDTAPAWPEVLTWTGDGPVVRAGGAPYKTRCNQRGRRITRLNTHILEWVCARVDQITHEYTSGGLL